MIQDKLIQCISPYLKERGDTGEDISLMEVAGGSIHKAYRVKTKKNIYFMKVQDRSLMGAGSNR